MRSEDDPIEAAQRRIVSLQVAAAESARDHAQNIAYAREHLARLLAAQAREEGR